jgi:hypothetical protein
MSPSLLRPRLAALLKGLVPLLAFVFALSAPPAEAATEYMFIPGHGLTRRQAGATLTIQDTIDECNVLRTSTSPVYKVKMQFVEEEYLWKDLETADNVFNFTKIIGDAQKCNKPWNGGMKLRALIVIKFGGIPAWLDPSGVVSVNNGATTNIKLDQDWVYQKVKRLFDKLATAMKADAEAWAGFYGIVLQETALGAAAYFDNGTAGQMHVTGWFTNLRKLHGDLHGFLVKPSDPKPNRRLFWQMINANLSEVDMIVTNLTSTAVDAGGLCTPDTFPKEPHGMEQSVIHAYDTMRTKRNVLPISLHVYSENYRAAYHGSTPPAEQFIWSTDDANPYGGPDGAPDGIANFLGCVANPDVIQNPKDSIRAHNVVWSMATGTSFDPILNQNFTWGWSKVKTWMQSANATAGTNGSGGCNTAIPTAIQ